MEKVIYILCSLAWILPVVFCENCTAAKVNETNIPVKVTDENQDEECVYKGTIWTLGEDLVQFAVVCNNKAFAAFEVNKGMRDGKHIWISSKPGYKVVTDNTTSREGNRGKRPCELKYDKSRVHEYMLQVCQIKELQNRNIVALIKESPLANRNIVSLIEESPLASYSTLLVLAYLLWKIVTFLFGILVNCCTLRKVNERSKNCCCSYIFSSLCSSLTNRHIFLNQQRDIEILKIELRGGKSKDECKSVNSEFVYLTNDIYGY